MTSKRIIFAGDGGGVGVVVPSPQYVQQLMSLGLSETQAVEAIRDKDVPPTASEVAVVEADTLPGNRRLRDAWKRVPEGVAIDGPKARAILTENLAHECSRRIDLVAPRNDREFTLGLATSTLNQARGRSYTPEEEAVIAAGNALMAPVLALRGKRDTLIAALAAMDETALNAFDPQEDGNWV